MQYAIVEKANKLAVHGLFDTLERAKRHLDVNIPFYLEKSLFDNKALTADSFEVVETRAA